jgi:hypothetical protein
MKKIICNQCKKEFSVPSIYEQRTKKFCSCKCYWESLKGKMPKSPPPHKPTVYINCLFCNKNLKRIRTKQKFCSRKCSRRYYSKKCLVKLICKRCGKIFYKRGSSIRIFCSNECYRKYNVKENSPSWKGGIKKDKDRRKSLDMVNWRNNVFERDGYTCQICNKVGGYIQPHHILMYSIFPQQRSNINNGITLCLDCHKLLHKTIGKLDLLKSYSRLPTLADGHSKYLDFLFQLVENKNPKFFSGIVKFQNFHH